MLTKLFAAVIAIAQMFISFLFAGDKKRGEISTDEIEAIIARGQRTASQFYCLEDNEDLKEITCALLNSDDTEDHIKQLIIATGRRFFLFRYPSDSFRVKGIISFVPNPSGNPMLVYLRGGRGMIGLTHPAIDLTCMRNYTVITTTYRGGVSEGIDEFGVCEVDDVAHLMQYFPTLQEKLGISFKPSDTFMLGASRGGMEMFLALAKTPELQKKIKKAASLSGLMDMNVFIQERKDMKEMFMRDFGFIPNENGKEWIKRRNPLNAVSNIRSDLPFFILQGTDDIQVSLAEGYHMVKKLEENGNPVTYLEVPGGDHCLRNQSNRSDIIADWFES